jgi:hypothetical protein
MLLDLSLAIRDSFAWWFDHTGGWLGVVAAAAIAMIAMAAINITRTRLQRRRVRAIWGR